jgi:hypothetical protein
LATAVRLWPTPKAQESGWTVAQHRSRESDVPVIGERVYDKETGVHRTWGLSQAIQVVEKRWPTPTAAMTTGPGGDREGTPNLQTAVADWPTPKARDYRSASGNEDRHSPDLNVAALWATPRAIYGDHPGMTSQTHLTGQANEGKGGALNPDWVCALMNFPPGWLDIGPPDPESGNTPTSRPEP